MERHAVGESEEIASAIVRRLDLLTLAALVFQVVTIILLGIAMTLPWWAFFTNGTMSAWYLGTTCGNGTCASYYGYPSLRDTFGLTGALVSWSIVLEVIALGLTAVSIVWPRFGILVFVVGVLGSVLIFIAPVYLYFALPGALSSAGFGVPVDGFFGSASSSGFFGTTQYSWTGAAGWFMSWAIFLFSLVATGVAYVSVRRRPRKATAPLRGEPAGSHPGAASRFCPVCGARYPVGTKFCSDDATPLKNVV